MKRESQASIARRHGVKPATICVWRKKGLNIYDDAEVAAAVAGRNPGQPPPGSTTPKDVETYGEARARRERSNADKAAIEVEKMRGSVVSNDSVLSAGHHVGLAIRQAFLKMEGELTPRIAGLSSAKAAKVIRAYAREKLTELRDLEYVNTDA